jgi:hypothetical protein
MHGEWHNELGELRTASAFLKVWCGSEVIYEASTTFDEWYRCACLGYCGCHIDQAFETKRAERVRLFGNYRDRILFHGSGSIDSMRYIA